MHNQTFFYDEKTNSYLYPFNKTLYEDIKIIVKHKVIELVESTQKLQNVSINLACKLTGVPKKTYFRYKKELKNHV